MKGLLIKDFCLLRNQKRLLPIFALLAVWFTVLHTDGFAFPFLGMMSTILTASTISYDELDRCQTALFTLPFERGTYVAEKYVLGAIMLIAVALGTIIPLRIRFGGDQGRIVLYVAFALIALAVVGVTRLLPKQTADLGGRLMGLSPAVLTGLLAVVAAAVCAVGCALGVRWIKAKEF